jgi:hypothetical protein
VAFQLNTAGLPTYDTFPLDQIGVADDGVVYGANLAQTADGDQFAIYSWSSVNAGAVPGFAYGTSASGGDPGNGSGDRWGDTMAIRGSGPNTEILFGSYAGTNVVLFTTADGVNFSPNLIPVTTAGVPAGFSGLGIAFGAGNTFWAKGGHNYNLRQVAFDTNSWTGTVLQTFIAGTDVPNDLTGLGVDVAANVLGGVCFNDTPDDLQLYELSGNTNPPALFNQAFFGSNNANAQENAATTLKGGLGFSLDVNNGLTAISYSVPAAPPVTISSAVYQPGTGIVLTWDNCFNGHKYQVQYKNAVPGGSWNSLGSAVTAVGPTASFTDTHLPLATARFYRVQSQ